MKLVADLEGGQVSGFLVHQPGRLGAELLGRCHRSHRQHAGDRRIVVVTAAAARNGPGLPIGIDGERCRCHCAGQDRIGTHRHQPPAGVVERRERATTGRKDDDGNEGCEIESLPAFIIGDLKRVPQNAVGGGGIQSQEELLLLLPEIRTAAGIVGETWAGRL